MYEKSCLGPKDNDAWIDLVNRAYAMKPSAAEWYFLGPCAVRARGLPLDPGPFLPEDQDPQGSDEEEASGAESFRKEKERNVGFLKPLWLAKLEHKEVGVRPEPWEYPSAPPPVSVDEPSRDKKDDQADAAPYLMRNEGGTVMDLSLIHI